MTRSLFLAAALLLVGGVTFAADKPKAVKLNYQDHVLPIFREKCIACHDSDKMKGGLDLSSYTAMMEGGGSGAVVKPGDADASRLFATIAHKVQPFMPPKADKLPQPILDTIQKWIEEGALENSGSKAVVAKPKTDVGLTSVVRGRPPGPPPMPLPGSLKSEPLVVASRPNAVTAIAANPWSPLVAVAGHKQVLLYDADTNDLIGVLPFPYGLPTVLRFSRNGSLLLAGGGRGGQSGKVVVWSVKTGEMIIEVGDETDAVLAADISADQTQIALGGPSKMIRIYSTKDGQKVREIKKHTDWIYAIEYSPDGVLLATADRNGGLFVWEAFNGREYFSLRGHTAAVTGLSWRADSNILASCSEDTTVRLWEMENGGQVKSWGAHGGGVQSVSFSHDGHIASVGRDRLAKVWDQNGAQKVVNEAFPDVVLRCAFVHDNSKVVAGDWTGQVRFIAAGDGKTLGAVTNNPPPMVVQFETAMKELVAKQAAFDQAKSAADASAATLQAAQANLAAAQKAVTDTAAAVPVMTNAMNQAKAEVEKAKSNVPPAQAKVTAKELSTKALTEVVAKLKSAADAAMGEAALVAEQEAAQKLVATATAELEAAKKVASEAEAAVTAMAAKAAEAEKALAAAQAAMEAAPKMVEQRTAELKAATEAHNAAQAALGQAQTALLAATKTATEKFQALTPKQ